jgi:hypothetical protein
MGYCFSECCRARGSNSSREKVDCFFTGEIGTFVSLVESGSYFNESKFNLEQLTTKLLLYSADDGNRLTAPDNRLNCTVPTVDFLGRSLVQHVNTPLFLLEFRTRISTSWDNDVPSREHGVQTDTEVDLSKLLA